VPTVRRARLRLERGAVRAPALDTEAFARAACGASAARVIWRILPSERLRKALQYRANRWDVPAARRAARPPAVYEAAEALLAAGYAQLAAERDAIVLVCPWIE